MDNEKKFEKIGRKDFFKIGAGVVFGGIELLTMSGCGLKQTTEVLGEPCNGDNMVENSMICLDGGEKRDLHMSDILAKVMESNISESGKNKLSEISFNAEELFNVENKMNVYVFKNNAEGAVPATWSITDKNGFTRHLIFLYRWNDSPGSAEDVIHELTHVLQNEKPGDGYNSINEDSLDRIEAEASYWGILGGVAKCQVDKIPFSEAERGDHDTNMYPIVDLLDKKQLSTDTSELYYYYFDMDRRLYNLEFLEIAGEYVNNLNYRIELASNDGKNSEEEVSQLRQKLAEISDVSQAKADKIREITDRWKGDVGWSEQELTVKKYIDENLLPENFYESMGSILKHSIIWQLANIINSTLTTNTQLNQEFVRLITPTLTDSEKTKIDFLRTRFVSV